MTLTRKIRLFLQKIFPASLIRSLAFLFGVLIPAKRSYSSYGEDLIIAQYFQDRKIFQGIYIDIGCFHPIWSSNTYKFHKLGWSGYCFDIDEFKLKMMRLFRQKKVQTFFKAVVPKTSIDQENDFITVFKFLTSWSDIDTCDLQTAKDYSIKYDLDFITTNVPCEAINSILKNLPKVNFFKIDIEGLDEAILMEMNLDLYTPEVILFENIETWSGTQEIKLKLEQYGYERLFISNYSVCYAQPVTR